MIMATISENLQIIKDSTDAIKQAIIDKGGTIEGDITTWASVISGISGGGSSGQELIFEGTIENYDGPGEFIGLDIYGDLTSPVEDGYVIVVVYDSNFENIDKIGVSRKLYAIAYDTHIDISIQNTNISDNNLVSMFFTSVDFSKSIPIKINR